MMTSPNKRRNDPPEDDDISAFRKMKGDSFHPRNFVVRAGVYNYGQVQALRTLIRVIQADIRADKDQRIIGILRGDRSLKIRSLGFTWDIVAIYGWGDGDYEGDDDSDAEGDLNDSGYSYYAFVNDENHAKAGIQIEPDPSNNGMYLVSLKFADSDDRYALEEYPKKVNVIKMFL